MADELAQQPGAEIFDISGPEPQKAMIGHEELQDAVMSGQFSLPKGKEIHVFDPEGQLATISSEEAADAFKNGFKYALPNEVRAEKYGSLGQQAITGLEGVAEGVAGPLAPLAEHHLLGVSKEDILARREENPITHGAGQVAGLAGSLLTGVGEGALLAKAGSTITKAVGLGSEAVRAAPLVYKVGSSAVQQAAEMAILQGSDEVSKMILNDPKTSAESAIANIGLSAALGGAGGAFITGAVSPLWEVTGAPLLEKTLAGFRNHLNQGAAVLPDELKVARDTLGIQIKPEVEAAMSGSDLAAKHFSVLKETGNKEITQGLEQLHKDIGESVARSLGTNTDDIAMYSENQAGHDLLDAFKREYKTKYEPVAEAMEKRNATAANITVPDELRLEQKGLMFQNGMEKVGTDSPTFKLYENYGERLMAKNDIGGMDKLKTEIGGEIEKAMRAGDVNSLSALKDIRSQIADFQEQMIENHAYSVGAKGLQSAEEIIAERRLANGQYRDFAKMSGELTDNLGVGKFKGAGSLTNKLADQVSAEQLLNKFSFKGNSDFIPFLQKNFPETFNKVKENELKRFLKPSILSAKEGQSLNMGKLTSTLEKTMSGNPEYVKALLNEDALSKIQAANKLQASIPNVKSSGTAGHIARLFEGVPRSAMAAVAMLTGHNPLVGAVLGEVSQTLGRDVPDAIRLAHLKYLASDQPIKPSAFKAMVEFFDSAYKGEATLAKATKAVFTSGAQVIPTSMAPNEADRSKLDKIVTQMQKTPDKLFDVQKGDVGHYLPNHQQALSQTSAQALQYLQSIKPQPHILGPLDKPVPPQPNEIARYNRALNIAQNPNIILNHIKEGTLQVSDIKDLDAMYPGVLKNMQQRLTNHMINAQSEDKMINYKSRISLALFLGQPLDATMTPQAIMSAQTSFAPKQPQQGQGAPQGKSTKAIGNSNNSYMTPLQSSESHRAGKR